MLETQNYTDNNKKLQQFFKLFPNAYDINQHYIIGLSKYQEEELNGKKKILANLNLKNSNQYISIKDLFIYDLAFYDETLHQIFLKKNIKYWCTDSEKNINFKTYLFLDMFHYVMYNPISSNQRRFFRLINIPRIFKKFFHKKSLFFDKRLYNKKKNFEISKDILTFFFKQLKKKIIWKLLINSQINNTTLNGFIIKGTPFKGFIITISNLYIFFMPTSHMIMKKFDNSILYVMLTHYLVGHIIEFKILNLSSTYNKLKVISRKKVYSQFSEITNKKKFIKTYKTNFLK